MVFSFCRLCMTVIVIIFFSRCKAALDVLRRKRGIFTLKTIDSSTHGSSAKNLYPRKTCFQYHNMILKVSFAAAKEKDTRTENFRWRQWEKLLWGFILLPIQTSTIQKCTGKIDLAMMKFSDKIYDNGYLNVVAR